MRTTPTPLVRSCFSDPILAILGTYRGIDLNLASNALFFWSFWPFFCIFWIIFVIKPLFTPLGEAIFAIKQIKNNKKWKLLTYFCQIVSNLASPAVYENILDRVHPIEAGYFDR